MRNVHYACGRNILPTDAWLNIDNLTSGSFPFGIFDRHADIFNCDLLRRHPFPDNHWDVGICEDFLEHITEPQAIRFLTEVARTLKTSGKITISTPSWEGIMSVSREPAKASERYSKSKDVIQNLMHHYDDWEHVNFWSEGQLVDLMRALGFFVCETPEEHLKLMVRPDAQAALTMTLTFQKM